MSSSAPVVFTLDEYLDSIEGFAADLSGGLLFGGGPNASSNGRADLEVVLLKLGLFSEICACAAQARQTRPQAPLALCPANITVSLDPPNRLVPAAWCFRAGLALAGGASQESPSASQSDFLYFPDENEAGNTSSSADLFNLGMVFFRLFASAYGNVEATLARFRDKGRKIDGLFAGRPAGPSAVLAEVQKELGQFSFAAGKGPAVGSELWTEVLTLGFRLITAIQGFSLALAWNGGQSSGPSSAQTSGKPAGAAIEAATAAADELAQRVREAAFTEGAPETAPEAPPKTLPEPPVKQPGPQRTLYSILCELIDDRNWLASAFGKGEPTVELKRDQASSSSVPPPSGPASRPSPEPAAPAAPAAPASGQGVDGSGFESTIIIRPGAQKAAPAQPAGPAAQAGGQPGGQAGGQVAGQPGGPQGDEFESTVIIRKGVPVGEAARPAYPAGEASQSQQTPAENSHGHDTDFESTVIVRPGASAPASEREPQTNADHGGLKAADDDAVVNDLDSTVIIHPRKKR